MNNIIGELIIVFVLFFLSAIAKSQCDRKAFKEGGVEASSKGWLMKVPLSMFLGKWHFWDFVRVMSLCILAVVCLNIPIYWALVMYVIHGLIFELLYGLK